MFQFVKENAGQDWLPTPVRAVALVMIALFPSPGEKEKVKGKEKERVEAYKEAFGFGLGAGFKAGDGAQGKGGELEGNVEGYKGDEKEWRDIEMMARAAVVYSRLVPGEEVVEKAKEVLCMVSTGTLYSSTCLGLAWIGSR